MGKEIGCVQCGHLISTEGFSPSRIEIKCKFCKTVNHIPKVSIPRKEYVRYTGIRLNAIYAQDKII